MPTAIRVDMVALPDLPSQRKAVQAKKTPVIIPKKTKDKKKKIKKRRNQKRENSKRQKTGKEETITEKRISSKRKKQSK